MSEDLTLEARRRQAQDELDLGLAHRQAGSLQMAAEAFRCAAELAPESAVPWYHLGAALMALGDLAEAEPAMRRAAGLDPTSVHAAHDLGAILVQQPDRVAEALPWLERAAALAPDNAVARRDHATCLLFLGRLDQARAGFLAAARLDPTIGQLLATAVELTPAALYPDEAEELGRLMGALAARADTLAPLPRSDLLFGLGRMRAAARDYDGAFDAYARANAARRSTIAYNPAAHHQAMARAAKVFDAVLMERLAGAGHPSARPVFIVGLPRSGTTLVDQIIAAHPMAASAGESPIMPDLIGGARGRSGGGYPDFAVDLQPADLHRFGEWYLARLPQEQPGELRRTDKRLENAELLGLIHLSLPNAPLIWCRRDLRDAGWSCFTTSFLGGQPWAYDLAEIAGYARALQTLMRHWQAVLPPGRLLEVDYEALVANPEPQARRILAHCGLPWDPACLDFHKSAPEVRSASAAQIRRPISAAAVGRWKSYEAHLGQLL